MPILLSLSGKVSPAIVEEGQSLSVAINCINGAGDTGFQARANLQAPEGFHIVSPNPTLLGNLGPDTSENFTFTINTSEGLQEGTYPLTVSVTCEEHHFGQKNKEVPFVLSLRVSVVESAKKRAARMALAEVEQSIGGLNESVAQLQRAGGAMNGVKLEQERLIQQVQKTREFFATRSFDKVIGDCEVIASTSSALEERSKKQTENLRNQALAEIQRAEELKQKASWANPNLLTNFAGIIESANLSYKEGKYSEALKLATGSIDTLPEKPLRVYAKDLWDAFAKRRRKIGLGLAIIGAALTLALMAMALDGVIPLLSIIPSISIALIGLGITVGRT
jgi:hypothetical protein